jgi:hypothetical protein
MGSINILVIIVGILLLDIAITVRFKLYSSVNWKTLLVILIIADVIFSIVMVIAFSKKN